jgi:Ser/Thr protein kinase RdoA (MazF antagonist)
VFSCGNRWAELETFIPHERPAPTLESYSWMFRAMGRLHIALSGLDLTVPRPLVATYAPPSSLRRWLRGTQSVFRHDSQALETMRWTGDLLNRLQRQWIPATRLPRQLVHGDVRLGNVARNSVGETVHLDFGFLAMRPRLHDLAYSIAFMVIELGGHRDPAHFSWQWIAQVIEKYETASTSPLSGEERSALASYTAAVPLYFTALAGFSNNPVGQLHRHGPWLAVSEWILTHPEALLEC